MIPDEILEAYRFYSEKMFGEPKKFPYAVTRPPGGDKNYVEISADGKMAFVGMDRGIETARDEASSVDELMYFIFRIFAFSDGFFTGPSGRSFFGNHKCVADELGKLNPAWRERYIREHEHLFVGQNVKW